MNRYTTSHPDAECLLQYADGELSVRQAAQVRTHLEACWRCRTEIEKVQAAITDYVRYQQAIFDSPPVPPASWETFDTRLDRLIAGRQKRPAQRWFGLTALIAAAAICFLVFALRRPPVVSAAELLRKASEKEVAVTHHPRRLRIRDSANHSQADLRTLFVEAHYNFDDPLSASSFRTWRDSLADRRDEVALQSGVYQVRTGTESGSLQEAILSLRADDLGVVSGSFRFRSQERVEMTALPDEAAPPVDAAAPEPRHPPEPIAPSSTGPAEELRVLAALHTAGADQGEQVELSRDPAGRLVVTATGLPPARRAAIESSLSALSDVILRFPQPTIDLSKPTQGAGGQSRSAAPDAVGRLQLQLQAALGGASELSNFTGQVLEMNEAAMVQAHDLRNLAARFPPDVELRLDSEDRATLTRLRRDYVQALGENAAALDRLLVPVLTSLGAPAVRLPGAPAGSPNWQDATEALFTAAQRFDRTVTTLLTGADANLQAGAVPETDRALRQFRIAIDWYQRY